MKFTIASNDSLSKALHKTVGIIGSRSTLPILGNVLIEADNGKVTLTTTDLEVRISTTLEASVEIPGRTTIPAKRLLGQVVNFDHAASVSFTTNERHHTTIVCGRAKCNLPGIPVDDFPLPTDFQPLRSFKLKEREMARAIDQVSYTISVDDSRKVLHGMLLSIRERVFTGVGTDGKRLSLVEISVDEHTGDDGDSVLPLRSCGVLKGILDKEDGDVSVEIGENQILFKSSSSTLTSKLIEGVYPNYRQVIPTAYAKTIKVPVDQFLAALKAPMTLISDSGTCVKMTFADNQLRFYGASGDGAEADTSMDIEYNDAEISVLFTPSFLAVPFSKMSVDEALFKMNDPGTPVAIEGGDGFLYVIMPLKQK